VASVAAQRRRRWTGLAPAERQAERRELLLDAAFELVGAEGWAAATVRAVVERAGLNPRYFYESFADLDALLVALYDRVLADLTDFVVAALDTSDMAPAAFARAAVMALITFVDEDRRRGRVLFVEGPVSGPVSLRKTASGRGLIEFIEHYAAQRDQPLAGEPIGQLGAAILVGGFGQVMFEWLEGRLPVTRERLIEDTTELFVAVFDTATAIGGRRSRRAR